MPHGLEALIDLQHIGQSLIGAAALRTVPEGVFKITVTKAWRCQLEICRAVHRLVYLIKYFSQKDKTLQEATRYVYL